MIDTDKHECPHCKTVYSPIHEGYWYGVLDVHRWETTGIFNGFFEEDGGLRYINNADIDRFFIDRDELKRLRKQFLAYQHFMLWVEEEHNEVFDEYERKDEL